MTNEEIVGLVQNGNKEIYKEIVEKFAKQLFCYIRKMVNQPDEEIDDLLQEVFISAYINIQSFDIKKRFSSWIYRVAHNKCVDYMKKKKIKVKITDNDEFFEENNKLMEDVMIENEDKTEINGAIKLLDKKYREVIILYYYEDKSYDEISEILRIPINNVGVILFRAKEKLKVLLKNYEGN